MISLVSLVSLLVSGVMAVQRWEEQPSSTFVNPGGEVSLACRIANKMGDCRWEMRQVSVVTNSKILPKLNMCQILINRIYSVLEK